MKKLFTAIMALGMMIATASLLFTSCTKEGPQGPPGADGQDMNATCTQCHNFSDDIVAKIVQYNASMHGTGQNFERNGVDCAPCHTSQGFREVLVSGLDTTAAAIMNPAPVNCRTCHQIHETYTTADWAVRTTDPITLMINGATIDLAGSANLCGRCHQSRKPNPYPVLGKADVTINSDHWGPHYGSQGPVMGSTGAIEIPGSMSYNVTSGHKDVSCYTCHGKEAYGAQAGGHTFYMSYAYHGQTRDNVAVCKQCHSSIQNTFDLFGVQTEIGGLLTQLEDQLLMDGYIDSTLHIVPGTYTGEEAAIVMNYLLIHYDHSLGIHNYGYSKAVLVNAYEALMALK
jgi:hypothetical protein